MFVLIKGFCVLVFVGSLSALVGVIMGAVMFGAPWVTGILKLI
jgi:ABC-type Co2+ transport system permease subunit